MALVAPSLPGSLLAGVMVGFVSLQPGAQRPFATRVAAVRAPAPAADRLIEGNRYLENDAEIAEDLRGLGLPVEQAPKFAADLGAWLRLPVSAQTPLSPEEITGLVSAADRLWLATL